VAGTRTWEKGRGARVRSTIEGKLDTNMHLEVGSETVAPGQQDTLTACTAVYGISKDREFAREAREGLNCTVLSTANLPKRELMNNDIEYYTLADN